MNKFRGAVFDLDDTLLHDDLSISDYTVNVFQRLHSIGIFLITASGRSQLSMKPFVDELGCISLYIACNGAEIWETKKSDLLRRETFSPALAMEILDFGDKFHAYAQTYGGDCFYFNEHSVYAERYAAASRLHGVYVGDLHEFIKEPRTKILMMSEEDTITRMLSEARKQFDGRISVTCSKPYFLEFNPVRATKGIALEYAANYLGMTAKDFIAFGDSLNDLPMLKAAGYSVSVANGRKELRDQCDDICGTNEEDGVAHYLFDCFLSGRSIP